MEPVQRRRWVIVLAVAAILALAAFIVYQTVSFVHQPPARRGRFQQDGGNQPVGLAVIGRGDIRIVVKALGAVTPLATVIVVPQISGVLMSVGFKEGQQVRKGQFLAQIDPRPYQVALEQDQAQLARDGATLQQAQMDLDRYKTLVEQTSIARQTYEDQTWIVKTDQGTVDYDKAQIKAQQLNLTYCRITAPENGRVGLRLIDPGNYVQTSTTTGIVVMTRLDPTTVEYAVPEDALPQIMARVHAGATLPVTVFDRANVNQLASGEFAAIDTQVNTTTGTVMLRATFANTDQKLFPSQFVNVVMLLDTHKDVVRVPIAAVQRGAPGTYVYFVSEGNTVAVHPITLGAQDGDFYAVESGLQPGDRVVTDGADRLRDGAKVSIPENTPPAGAAAPGKQPGHERGDRPHRHRRQPGDASGDSSAAQGDAGARGQVPAQGQPPAQAQP